MIADFIERVRGGEIVTLTPEDLEELLARVELIFEEDTYLSNEIRILRFDGLVLLQEYANKSRIILRVLPSIEDAQAFVAKRLESYERMWDGCGCKIAYFDA